MSKRRVLFLTHDLDTTGGVQNVARSTARLLVARADAHQTRILAQSGDRGTAQGFFRSSRGSNRRFQLEVLLQRLLCPPDLVICDHLYTGRFAVRAGLRNIGVWAHLIEFEPPLAPIHAKTIEAVSFVFCNSEFTRERLAEWHPALRNKLRTVTLGAESDEVAGSPLYKQNLSRKQLLVVGRMEASERYKGHDEILEALPSILSAHPEAIVQFVGGGNDRERLEAKAHSLGVAANAHFAGPLRDDALESVWKQSTALILPSRREGFGLVYLDALRRGIPAIALRGTVAQEVLGDCGAFADSQSRSDLATAIGSVLEGKWEHESASLERFRTLFSRSAFEKRFEEALSLELSRA